MKFIPTPSSDDTLYRVRLNLDGSTYFFEYDWNSLHDTWSLRIRDVAGETIVAGIRLVPDTDLLGLSKIFPIPPGLLVAYTLGNVEITRESMDDCSLVYFEESELV